MMCILVNCPSYTLSVSSEILDYHAWVVNKNFNINSAQMTGPADTISPVPLHASIMSYFHTNDEATYALVYRI